MDKSINTYIMSSDKTIDSAMSMIEYSFSKYWPESNIIVLGYREPTSTYKNVKFQSLGNDLGPNKVCSQLYDFFSSCKEEQFIFGVDDMPLMEIVDNNMIEYAHELLNLNKNIGRFGLTADNASRSHALIEQVEDNQLIKSSFNDPYKLSCTYSIWNREYFLLYLRDFENLWQLETYGSQKSIHDNWEIYSFAKGLLNHSHVFKKGQLKGNWDRSCYTNEPLSDVDKNEMKKIYSL